MENCLLLLDELDDAVFVLVSRSHLLRRLCLQVGLTSALALVGLQLIVQAPGWASALASVAGASVALWFLVALALVARRLDPSLRALENPT